MVVVPPRKPGTLLPIEAEILTTALALHRGGQHTFQPDRGDLCLFRVHRFLPFSFGV